MGELTLQDWASRKRFWRLRREDGRLFSDSGGEAGSRISGFVHKQGDDTYVLYIVERNLIFRVNDKEWDTSRPEFAISYRRFLGLEWIRVVETGSVVFSRRYNSIGAFWQLLSDPTTDRIDEQGAFFLDWCSRLLASESKKAATIENWQKWRAD